MLSPDDHAKLIELAQRAVQHPLDLRNATKSRAQLDEFGRIMESLVIRIGTLRIMFAYEAVPPSWQSMRHLSVSDAGKRPSDELFVWIAEVMGMGAPDTWDAMTATLEKALQHEFVARHAMKMPD